MSKKKNQSGTARLPLAKKSPAKKKEVIAKPPFTGAMTIVCGEILEAVEMEKSSGNMEKVYDVMMNQKDNLRNGICQALALPTKINREKISVVLRRRGL